MPPGRPQRESTGSVDSTASPSRRRRVIHWKADRATKLSRSSLDVLVDWLAAPGNFARWTASQRQRQQRQTICHEINEELHDEGITHRQNMDIGVKLSAIERSFVAAKKWLEETALLPKFLEGKAGKDVTTTVQQLCPQYKKLAPAFAALQNASAAATIVEVYASSDSSSRSSNDDSDDATVTSEVVTQIGSGNSNDNGAFAATSDAQRDATRPASPPQVASKRTMAPPDPFMLSESSQSEPLEQSIVRDSASPPSKSALPDAVEDNDNETKAPSRLTEQPQPQLQQEPLATVRTPPKQSKRLRQRLLPQPMLTDDELTQPSQQHSPGRFMPRTRASSLSLSLPMPSSTPAPASTPSSNGSNSPAATATTIASKRKTSPSTAVITKEPAPSTSTTTTAHKKRKTTQPPATSNKKQQSAASASTPANKTRATTPVKPSTPAKTPYPEELAAILRACEEEREQRNTLFALQCDKLMQELEERKVAVVFETARARQKLLDLGVDASEVDRILPL